MKNKVFLLVWLALLGLNACGERETKTSGAHVAEGTAQTVDSSEDGTTSLQMEDDLEHADVESDTGHRAVLEFAEDSHDFGIVKEGKKVTHEYVFTNTGEAPLIVLQVTASCGCTTPEYSRKPVAPGEKGRIQVVFDSEGQVGRQHKIITVVTNAREGVALLHLRGEVQSKK